MCFTDFLNQKKLPGIHHWNLSVTAVCVNWITFQRMFSIEGIQGMNDWKAWDPVHRTENGAEIEIGGENI